MLLKMSNARKAAVLTGLFTDQKKNVRIQQLQDFFHDELEVFTRIEDAYAIGNAEPQSVVNCISNDA